MIFKTPKNCIICGTVFKTKRPEHFKTCSKPCAIKHARNTSKIWHNDPKNREQRLQNTLKWQAKNQAHLKQHRHEYYLRKKKERSNAA